MRELLKELREGRSDRYYRYGGQSIQQIIDLWQKEGKQLYDSSSAHGSFATNTLYPYREYSWTKAKARRSPKEWDELAQSIKKEGIREPLHFIIGRAGGAKIGEGNHRLAIAREIGLDQLPVIFQFYTGNVTKQRMPKSPARTKPLPPAIKKAAAQTKPRTPEEEKRLKDVMDLLSKFF